jgi:hypothetical protein
VPNAAAGGSQRGLIQVAVPPQYSVGVDTHTLPSGCGHPVNLGADPWGAWTAARGPGKPLHPDWELPGWGFAEAGVPYLTHEQAHLVYNGATLSEVSPPISGAQARRLSAMGVQAHRAGPPPPIIAQRAAQQQARLRAWSPGSTMGGAPSHYGDLGAGDGLTGWHGGGAGGQPQAGCPSGGASADSRDLYGPGGDLCSTDGHAGAGAAPWEGLL